MEQNSKNNGKQITKNLVTKNESLKLDNKIKIPKSQKYPKQGEPDFSWHHHTLNDSQSLNELDDIFGY